MELDESKPFLAAIFKLKRCGLVSRVIELRGKIGRGFLEQTSMVQYIACCFASPACQPIFYRQQIRRNCSNFMQSSLNSAV